MAVKLRVHANPYAALDHRGRPAGAVQIEGVTGSYVGARLVQSGFDPDVGSLLAGAEAADRHFEFESQVIEVPANAYYLYFLRTKELLPADEKTAREAGCKSFLPLESALAAERAKAIERYRAEFGKEPELDLEENG